MTATLLKRRNSGDTAAARRIGRARRHFRVRRNVAGTAERPRLVVTRSLRHIVAQLVDDINSDPRRGDDRYGEGALTYL